MALLMPFYWDGTQASNLQPADLETAALPIELIPYKVGGRSFDTPGVQERHRGLMRPIPKTA